MSDETPRLRAGVAGAGVFGGYHAGKYQDHEGVDLIGVFDVDPVRAGALADRTAAKPFTNFSDLLDACDIVTIATPATTHGTLALQAIAAGVHVLVEKPIATSLDEALSVAEHAENAGVLVQVGHQERFVFAAMGLFDVAKRPRRVTGWRCNPFSPRGADVSVSLDLMTHDLDLVRLLAGRADVSQLTAALERVRTDHPDRVEASITFDNGMEAHLTASRLHETRARGMRIEYDEGVVEVDFVAKRFTNTTAFALNPDYAAAPEAQDSLGAGVNRFIAAVQNKTDVAINAQDGAAAVQLALMADRAAMVA